MTRDRQGFDVVPRDVPAWATASCDDEARRVEEADGPLSLSRVGSRIFCFLTWLTVSGALGGVICTVVYQAFALFLSAG